MARHFDENSNQHIDVDAAHVASMNSAFTVAAWVNIGALISNECIYGEGRVASTNPFLQFQANTGKLRVFLRKDSNSGTSDLNGAATTGTIGDGTWHHAIFTQDASGNYQMYVDGAADTTGSYTTGTMTVDLTTFGGLRRNSVTLTGQLTGSVAEVATWTRQLTADEAKLLGSGLNPSYLSPAHYWPLWGLDSPEPDLVSSHTNGTLTNGPTYVNGPAVYLPRFSALFGHTAAVATAYSKSGFATTAGVAAGQDAFLFAETGAGLAGGVGGGIAALEGAGHAVAGLNGYGYATWIQAETGGATVGTGGSGGGVRDSNQDVAGRVLIAFDDGPLVPNPAWTRLDGGDAPFPHNFVSGYDVDTGRQTLLSQTDTGTATVHINDHETGLFDPRNTSSPYYGLLDGRQIRLQLYDPVALAWEDQFRGWIDDITWDIDPATGATGEPINASIQLQCVDMFDLLAGFGLTPGLDGVTPPAGGEDGVWYATTTGTNDDRIIQILADVGIPPDMYGSPSFASGNTHVLAVKYDPDESALQALRDAADADLPFIANIFCDRHGRFQFHGRYARFDPDPVSSEPGSDWDFTRWAVGDGAAIQSDSTRAQMRVLSFGRNRSDLINVAVCYPQDLDAADMPNQVFADTASITAYGKHSAPPMSDLLLDKDAVQPVTGDTGKVECYHYAKLLVLNQKDPRETITALQVKALPPTDDRASTTWALLSRVDISHIVNVAVGYPDGTGFTGSSPEDDYYVEGRHIRVRPLNRIHDYVELDLDVSPAVWSMDTHGVFPPFPGEEATPSLLAADFSVAY